MCLITTETLTVKGRMDDILMAMDFPNPVTIQTPPCPLCGEPHSVIVEMKDAVEWKTSGNTGRYVQDIFPYLTPGERELLITGIDERCFDLLCEEPDEEEDDGS